MDSDIREMYGLYKECFPNFPVTEESFFRIFLSENMEGIFHRENGRIVACAVLRDEYLTLICVSPAHRRRGIGTELLLECENRVRVTHRKTVHLGGGRPCIFQGVPEENADEVAFFRKRGYSGEKNANLILKLRDIPPEGAKIPPCPENVRFCYAGAESVPSLSEAVDGIFPDMSQMFLSRTANVFTAQRDKKVVGFALAAPAGAMFAPAGEKMGCIEYIGVRKEQRKQGIGRALIAEAVKALGEQGCTAVEIRNVPAPEWYAPVGFAPYCRMWAGKKNV